MTFSDDMTLGEARGRLRELVYHGERCPCCTQHAQVYRWSLYATAIRTLVALYRAGGTTRFVESKTVKIPGQGGDMSRLAHWHLVEQESVRRADGGRSGWWRVTPLGEEFLRGRATIPKYVYVFDGRRLKADGPELGIRECLGKKFSYDEMMAGLF